MPLRRRAFVACAILLVGHQFAQRVLEWRWAPVDGYLDPVLSIPLLLSLAEAEQRYLLAGRGWRGYTAVEIGAMTLALGFAFELLFPYLDPARQTSDPLDFLAYAVGGVLYGLAARQPNR